MPVVKEVAGDEEPRLMRHGPFATDGQPFVALDKTIEAFGDNIIGDCFVAPQAQGEIAGDFATAEVIDMDLALRLARETLNPEARSR